jgi:2-polyprenyl-6-methoxyphenol hydroxylase-like FAD-dependent oxidoreductase
MCSRPPLRKMPSFHTILDEGDHAMTTTYDAIVVGARCAGSPLAMLLARSGRRVLLVDRAAFPSDTVSAHTIQPAGLARLRRWGLQHVIDAADAPLVDTVRFDAGDIVLEGMPVAIDGVTALTAPRRHVLDALLLEEARAAGVEVRTGFAVRELLVEDGRVTGILGRDGSGSLAARAHIVVGADGAKSFVARSVGADVYNAVPATTLAAYTYYRGVDTDVAELYTRPDRFTVVVPTNDDTVVVSQSIAIQEAPAFRADIAAGFAATLEVVPQLAARIARGERTERFRLASGNGGFMRVPCGRGWALVGDAGYHKDPITAQGMLDAFRDAELLAGAIDAGLRAGRDAALDRSLAAYHAARDAEVSDMYRFTCDLARVHEPPPPHLVELLGALQGNPEQISRFLGLIAGTVRIADFFAPESLQAILGAGAVAA